MAAVGHASGLVTGDPRNPRSYVHPQELRELSVIRSGPIVVEALVTWVPVFVSIWLWAQTGHVLVLLAAFFVIATRQHALNNLVHEAAHFNLSRKKALNDWIGDIFFAAPHLISTAGYRGKHLMHHSYLGDHEKDAERKPRHLIRRWLFMSHSLAWILGYAAWESIVAYTPALAPGSGRPGVMRHLGLVAVTNLMLLGYCFLVGAPFAYFYLWLLPLFTLTLYLSTLRVVAEHQPEFYARLAREDHEMDFDPPLTRTITANLIEGFVLGPVKFYYHQEHHFFPAVPFMNLPALYRLLSERGYYRANPECLGRGYVQVLLSLIFARQSEESDAGRTETDRHGTSQLSDLPV